MNARFTPIPSTIRTVAQSWYVAPGIPARGPTMGEPAPRKSRAIPAARRVPPRPWKRRYRYPARIASPPSCQIRNVEVIAISSQKIEQGDPVPCKDHAERRSGIEQGKEVETGCCNRCGIEDGKERDDRKDHPRQVREAVNSQEDEGIPHKGQIPLHHAGSSRAGRWRPRGGGGHRQARVRRAR